MALDMTMMYLLHDALGRELQRITKVTARADDDPAQVLRTAVGWELFKRYLTVHHTAEDLHVWPAATAALTDRAGGAEGLALLEAMEAEHAAIDPLLADIDAALADRDTGPARLGELTDALYTGISGHLRHEEREALALIDATLTEEQWARFGAEHSRRIGDDARRYLPWILDGLPPQRAAGILTRMPEPIRTAYRDEWRPEFERLRLWG
ncbi:hemerythrin domain-containing protein [Dactylosporangium sp. NPDC005572]|uniref:hemerythrin domain-containing protein n=1 Tax=Dactylosporangium sp. NPDC005572 TaxID=3156889 RepID=UPI0033A7EE2D